MAGLFLIFALFLPADQDLNRARQLVADGRLDEAAAIYEILLKSKPGDPALMLNIAVVEFKAKRYDRVIERCRKIVDVTPSIPAAYLFLGASYFELGQPAAAVDPLLKVIQAQPNDRNARLMLAESLLLLERYREAAEHFQIASNALPDNPRVWYGLERSFQGLGEQAKAALERSASGSPYLGALLGDIFLKKQQYGLAFHHLRKALAGGLRIPGLHKSLAEIYRATGHPEWALQEEQAEANLGLIDVRDAALSAGEDPESLYWKALASNELASQALDRLAALPPSSELHEVRARMLDSRARYLDAAKEWRQALELAPKNPVLEKGLMMSLFNARDLVATLPLLEALLAREPGSAEPALLMGTIQLQLEQPGKAVPYLETALKHQPDSAAAHGALGEVYLKMGQSAKAIPQLQASLANDPDGARHFQLARAHQAVGNREESAKVLAEYRRLRTAWEARRREVEATYPIQAP